METEVIVAVMGVVLRIMVDVLDENAGFTVCGAGRIGDCGAATYVIYNGCGRCRLGNCCRAGDGDYCGGQAGSLES